MLGNEAAECVEIILWPCRSAVAPLNAAQCVGMLGDKETRTLMIYIVQEVCHLGMLCEPLTEVLRRRLPHVVNQLPTTILVLVTSASSCCAVKLLRRSFANNSSLTLVRNASSASPCSS